MIKRTYIKDLEESQIIIPDSNCYFLIRRSNVKTGKNATTYIDLELTDGEVSVNGKVWDVHPEIEHHTATGNIIHVLNGRITRYNGMLQIVLSDVELVDGETIDELEGIVPESKASLKDLLDRWEKLKNMLSEPYSTIVEAFEKSDKVFDLFKKIPAGKSMHHAYRRGLLEHSVRVGELSVNIAHQYKNVYPLNMDLMITGALLHDVGKVFEFQVNSSTSLVERYSDRGRLLGHIYMGSTFIEKIINTVLSEDHDIKMELLHLMLSHHGEYEFGSPKKPKTMDALILAMADHLDANLDAVHIALNADIDDRWTRSIMSLQRPFYKTMMLD